VPGAGRTCPVLLAVSMLPAWPVRNGYALRVRNLLAELAQDWELHLLAPAAAADDPERPPGIAAHHVLDLTGAGLTYACPEARERPAYKAQAGWLDLFGKTLEA